MRISSKKIDRYLLYLLGFFSTLQILEIFGITIFTLLSLITLFVLVIVRRVRFKGNKLVLLYLLCAFVTTIISVVGDTLLDYYKTTAILSFINTFIILFIYLYIKKTDLGICFIKGFKYSCYFQIIWCLLQFILFKLGNIDLNQYVFSNIFHMEGYASVYRDGELVCTGLHNHPANLIPILIFLVISSKNLFVKTLAMGIAFLTYSTTGILGVALALLYCIIRYLLNFKIDKTRIRLSFNVCYSLVLMAILLVSFNFFVSYISKVVLYVVGRFQQISSTAGGMSSVVHFQYYTKLPDILLQIPVINTLFGVGLSCSGAMFIKFVNQYVGSVWVVESDIVNVMLNVGVIGFLLFYAILIMVLVNVKKIDKKYRAMMIIFLICGVTYNIQFNWVILLELVLLSISENKKFIEEFKKIKF